MYDTEFSESLSLPYHPIAVFGVSDGFPHRIVRPCYIEQVAGIEQNSHRIFMSVYHFQRT
jgi:hypothetical protein